LSPQVYESIFTGRSKATVASRRKKLTIFFSDLEGFTETTERLESEDLTQLLNHYLTEMSKIALQFGGTIDKYVATPSSFSSAIQTVKASRRTPLRA
jgi:adenylate cyclase